MSENLNQDDRNLNLLAIFHYVVAGLIVLFSSIFIIHLVVGITAIVSPETLVDKNGQVPPPFFGWIFIATGGLAILFGWISAACIAIGGRFLKKRKKYPFCFVAATLSCLFIPIGTILGIFTIILLMKPQVKEQFDRKQ